MKQEKRLLSKLVLRLSSLTQTHAIDPQDITQKIWPNQITTKQKQKSSTFWKDTTKNQSKLQCYLALNRQYMVADYLTTVTDRKH